MPVAAEVDTLKREISSDEGIVFFASIRGKLEHGAIVSNGCSNERIFAALRDPTNLGDQRFFSKHHGNYYKRRWPVDAVPRSIWARARYNRGRIMHPERIAGLLEPFLDSDHERKLGSEDLNRISMYVDMLLRWNVRINLTGIRTEEEIVTRHFGESLFAARHLFPQRSAEATGAGESARVADLGSGAGFPGIPIKLWAPYLSVTLIEANLKKATFLREVVRALTLTSVDIQNVRAESLGTSSFEVVTLRAVEKFIDVLPVAGALVAPSGRLGLLIAAGQAAIAQALTGFVWEKPISIPEARSRILLIGTKGEELA